MRSHLLARGSGHHLVNNRTGRNRVASRVEEAEGRTNTSTETMGPTGPNEGARKILAVDQELEGGSRFWGNRPK